LTEVITLDACARASFRALAVSDAGIGHATAQHVHHSVEKTPLFSLGENAIARELGAGYPERWRRVS
jgi:hypothetical protein